jgi:copper oxidase (laccase) domain-containing protein
VAVLTADCAPVVLANDDAVAVVHAGHRGLLAGVIDRAVDEIRHAGRGTVRALLGPCIRPARYEFGGDDLATLAAALGDEVVGRTATGTPALDIPAGVRVVLERAGVDDLIDTGICTAESVDHYSYRRDGTTGRQATVAVLP